VAYFCLEEEEEDISGIAKHGNVCDEMEVLYVISVLSPYGHIHCLCASRAFIQNYCEFRKQPIKSGMSDYVKKFWN